MALTSLFDYRCAPPKAAVPAQGPQLQSICIADTCPISPNATCNSYGSAVEPGVANATLAMGQGNSSSTANASSVASIGTPTATAGLVSLTSSAAANKGGAGLPAVGAIMVFAFTL